MLGSSSLKQSHSRQYIKNKMWKKVVLTESATLVVVMVVTTAAATTIVGVIALLVVWYMSKLLSLNKNRDIHEQNINTDINITHRPIYRTHNYYW